MNAIGMNTSESDSSPAMEDRMARSPNLRPREATFILLITLAFTKEPARKARIDARATRGAMWKT